MRILESWMVTYVGKTQLLVHVGDGRFMITSNGGFGQRDMYWEDINEEEAHKLINQQQ